ncbi:hypothetical protein BJX62DRAFT_9628 [Aspergillus germanicus]
MSIRPESVLGVDVILFIRIVGGFFFWRSSYTVRIYFRINRPCFTRLISAFMVGSSAGVLPNRAGALVAPSFSNMTIYTGRSDPVGRTPNVPSSFDLSPGRYFLREKSLSRAEEGATHPALK